MKWVAMVAPVSNYHFWSDSSLEGEGALRCQQQSGLAAWRAWRSDLLLMLLLCA